MDIADHVAGRGSEGACWALAGLEQGPLARGLWRRSCKAADEENELKAWCGGCETESNDGERDSAGPSKDLALWLCSCLMASQCDNPICSRKEQLRMSDISDLSCDTMFLFFC